jgi:hypothetical protein
MDLWTAIVIIVLIASVSGVIKSKNDKKQSGDDHKQQQAAAEKIHALERRIENIESIVFELEKDRSFSQLERE